MTLKLCVNICGAVYTNSVVAANEVFLVFAKSLLTIMSSFTNRLSICCNILSSDEVPAAVCRFCPRLTTFELVGLSYYGNDHLVQQGNIKNSMYLEKNFSCKMFESCVEIFAVELASYLEQADLLHLILTNSRCFHATHRALYRSLTVGKGQTQLEEFRRSKYTMGIDVLLKRLYLRQSIKLTCIDMQMFQNLTWLFLDLTSRDPWYCNARWTHQTSAVNISQYVSAFSFASLRFLGMRRCCIDRPLAIMILRFRMLRRLLFVECDSVHSWMLSIWQQNLPDLQSVDQHRCQDSADEVVAMRKQAERLLENFDITKHPMTKFSTEEKTHINDRYFLDSSDNISFFLEEKAVDADGKLTVPKERAVNKIGHALHKLDPVFKKMSSKREISDLLRSLQYKDPIMLQSMLIFKQPFVGGKVMPHQDSTFLYTDPPSALGFWFPLETATEENGCLWFIPGSHKTHPISRRLVRNPDYFERDTDLKTPQSGIDSTVPTVKIRYEPGVIEEKFDDNAFIKAEVPAGAAVLLHGSVVHKSNENTSAKSRFVYAFHCVETGDGVKYSPENWLQMPAGVHFTKVYQNNCA